MRSRTSLLRFPGWEDHPSVSAPFVGQSSNEMMIPGGISVDSCGEGVRVTRALQDRTERSVQDGFPIATRNPIQYSSRSAYPARPSGDN